MTNREILRASGAVLSEVDRQRQYVLRVLLVSAPCPARGWGLSYLDAARIDIDEYEYDCDGASRHACACPCRGRVLRRARQPRPCLSARPRTREEEPDHAAECQRHPSRPAKPKRLNPGAA